MYKGQIKYLHLFIVCEYRLLNDLGFKLYIISPTGYIIAILEKDLSKSYNNKSKYITINIIMQ